MKFALCLTFAVAYAVVFVLTAVILGFLVALTSAIIGFSP